MANRNGLKKEIQESKKQFKEHPEKALSQEQLRKRIGLPSKGKKTK